MPTASTAKLGASKPDQTGIYRRHKRPKSCKYDSYRLRSRHSQVEENLFGEPLKNKLMARSRSMEAISQGKNFCYSWIPSLGLFFPIFFLLDLAKNHFTIILRSLKNMNFHKIWRVWLKNCVRHAHFNFELPKSAAALIFVPHFSNFGQL